MRLAIVNDLRLAVEALRRAVIASGHEVAWVARDGEEAVERCRRERPDLLLMDLVMPVLDGVGATRRIMTETPCPILIVTASIDRMSDRVFDALGEGALDAVETPVLGPAEERTGLLASKIEALGRLISARAATPQPLTPVQSSPLRKTRSEHLVVIGSSSGGPAALAVVLRSFPADFPASVVIVQHIDCAFVEGLASWLEGYSSLPVSVARSGQALHAGQVLVAGTEGHIVTRGNVLDYTDEPRDLIHRPSVDVFFHSVASRWTGNAQGVILTGMGRDGAQGLLALRRRGYHTIAQDEETSAIYGMPRAAREEGGAVSVLPLAEIGPALIRRLDRRTRTC